MWRTERDGIGGRSGSEYGRSLGIFHGDSLVLHGGGIVEGEDGAGGSLTLHGDGIVDGGSAHWPGACHGDEPMGGYDFGERDFFVWVAGLETVSELVYPVACVLVCHRRWREEPHPPPS